MKLLLIGEHVDGYHVFEDNADSSLDTGSDVHVGENSVSDVKDDNGIEIVVKSIVSYRDFNIYGFDSQYDISLTAMMTKLLVLDTSSKVKQLLRYCFTYAFIQALVNTYSLDECMYKALMNLFALLTLKSFQTHYESTRIIASDETTYISNDLKNLGLKTNSWQYKLFAKYKEAYQATQTEAA
ncbi:hypothetical protein PanWU01x14_083130 [Parasponia andersonii]|uniref:Uncharacterized protein n=1 Tax=Parasponia andersonii TaxID=3476 RepID=A0A2P5DA24_PARAD|nr:hypothetical protein PanWU01x14_083130 [Parasponia andersonii]